AGITINLSNGGGSTVTNASGNFTATGLQNRTYATVDFVAPGGNWAPVEFVNVRVNSATNMGTIVMQPGAVVSGIALGPSGTPTGAAGGNMNAYDITGLKLFTPNDAIGPTGAFSITVPQGWVRIRAVPVVGLTLIPFDWIETNLTGPLNLGTATLLQGYPLSGTVVDVVSGLPVSGVVLTATNPLTGETYAQLSHVTNV